MTPNLTVAYMAESIAREHLDATAARGSLAAEAAANRSTRSRVGALRWTLGAALVRAGALLQGPTNVHGVARPHAATS